MTTIHDQYIFLSVLKVSRHDVESLVRDIMRQRPGGRDPCVTRSPEGDLPPKYEELGDARLIAIIIQQ